MIKHPLTSRLMFELSMTIRQTINSSKTFDATSLISGKEFFGTLARHLCSSFTVDFMHVALFSKDDSQTMMTIYCGGRVELESPHLYFTSETFHKSLTEEGKFCCHQNAAERYPEDFLLTTMKVDSCSAHGSVGWHLRRLVDYERSPSAEEPRH
jgi:hypothetical protein